jgi:hypothetical protein
MKQTNETVFEPVLVADYPYRRNQHFAAWDLVKQELQEAVNSYNRLGLEPLNNREFERLFTDTESLMFDKFSDGKPMLAGLEVNKRKAMDLINKPAGYAEMMREIADVNELAKRGFMIGNTDARLDTAKLHYYFVLNDGKTVEYGKGLFETINKLGRYYAQTKQTADVYNFLQAVVDAYYANGLDVYDGMKQSELGSSNGMKVFSGDDTIAKLCSIIEGVDKETKKVKVKTKFFDNRIIHTGLNFGEDSGSIRTPHGR